MEFWVRSQDKYSLMKCDRVDISAKQVNGKKWEFAILAGCVNVGKYATKERCLEIIDEIQNLLIHNGSDNDKFAQMLSGIKNEFIVYEMPQE